MVFLCCEILTPKRSSQTKASFTKMKSISFFTADQKSGDAPTNLEQLIDFAREHFPNVPLDKIKLEFGIVSLELSVKNKITDSCSKQVRFNKNPR